MESNYNHVDKQLIFKIDGDIDECYSQKIRRRLDNEIERYMPKTVIFDFNRVSFMDSAGIGMLLGRYKVIKMLGGQLELMNVNKQVEKVFEISGILKIIPLIKNNEENVG